jgi:hypothetical protein
MMDEIGTVWRHKKRGTTYTIIGHGELQINKEPVDGAELVIYRGEDGRIWVRPEHEFCDGRFERMAPAPPAPEVANLEQLWERENEARGHNHARATTAEARVKELEAALRQIHDMWQSAFADHWAFRKAARDIARAALAGEQAPPAEAP